MNSAAKVLRYFRHSFHPLILVMFLSADIVFVLLHVSYKKLPVTDYYVLLDTENGYSEVFQYLKEFWAAGVLWVVFWRTREWIYLVWVGLMSYLLFDDSIWLHERLGEYLASGWSFIPPFGLRLRDLGEMLVSGTVGSVFLLLWALTYRRGSTFARGVTMDLLVLLGLLAFFGIFVDVLVMATNMDFPGYAIVEDGGEMWVMTLIAGYTIHLLKPNAHVPGKLWLWVRSLAEWCLATVLPKRG